MRPASKDSRTEVRRVIENHALDPAKILRQHELVVSDDHRERKSLRGRDEEAEKATVNIEDRLEPFFFLFTTLD